MNTRDPRNDPMTSDTLAAAISEASACRRCEAVLPLGPRPVFRVSDT
ncbi:MAG: hypothetical protein QOD93_5438, partial [Acetobacteraceae bacterium]|nr:hypothetical protein [Acetobacteraceae bacterium]